MERKAYYSTRDMMEILSISRTKALQLMHMFEYQGRVVRNGKLLRVQASAFDEWLRQNTIKQFLGTD